MKGITLKGAYHSGQVVPYFVKGKFIEAAAYWAVLRDISGDRRISAVCNTGISSGFHRVLQEAENRFVYSEDI